MFLHLGNHFLSEKDRYDRLFEIRYINPFFNSQCFEIILFNMTIYNLIAHINSFQI